MNAAVELFEKITAYPNYNIYVAVTGNKTVGTFELLIMDNLAHICSPSAIVEDVVVKTAFRGKGIGKKMMEFAIEESRKSGCYKMVLSSSLSRERAQRFYESLGFKKHGFSFQINLQNPV
ncbi:MAG: GNAT family N-acetyltransferase [Calditrichaceae bacterium]